MVGMTRSTALFVLAAALLASAGCNARLPRWHFIATPTATVDAVTMGPATDEGVAAVATLTLTNPNDVPLPLRITRYSIEVAGHASAMRDAPPVTLPAKGSHTLQLPIAIPLPADADRAALADAEARVRATIAYQPPGEVRRILYDSGVPLPTVGVHHNASAPTAAPAPQE